MKTWTKKSAAVYLIAMFLVGGAAGGMGGYCYGLRKAFTPPTEKDMAAHMAEFARKSLQLSDEQARLIQPILNETAAEFAGVQSGMCDRMNEIFQKASDRIAPL